VFDDLGLRAASTAGRRFARRSLPLLGAVFCEIGLCSLGPICVDVLGARIVIYGSGVGQFNELRISHGVKWARPSTYKAGGSVHRV